MMEINKTANKQKVKPKNNQTTAKHTTMPYKTNKIK